MALYYSYGAMGSAAKIDTNTTKHTLGEVCEASPLVIHKVNAYNECMTKKLSGKSVEQIDKPKRKYNKPPNMNNNPTGKGGFGDNPQNGAGGRWSKDTSISYWYNKLGRMTLKELEEFEKKGDELTPFQKTALVRVKRAYKGDSEGLAEAKEVADRTEGKAKQEIGIDASDDMKTIMRGFIIPTLPTDWIDEQVALARIKQSNV